MTWPVMRLKHLAAVPITNGLGEQGRDAGPGSVRYIRTTDILSPRELDPSKWASLEPELAARARVLRGDLLICAAGSLGVTYLHLNDEPACYAGYLARFRPLAGVDPRFIAYWAQSQSFFDQVATGAVRSTIDNFSAGKIRNLVLAVPPLEEQRRIADFLDTETTRLDMIEARRREQVRVLEQREASTLASLTLENASHMPVKRVVQRITSGPRGWGDYVSDNGSVFLRITNIPRRGIELLGHDVLRVAPPHGAERERTRTRIGDVLVSITADVGSVGLVDARFEDANVNQHVALVRPDTARVLPKWLAWQLKTPVSQERLSGSSYGGTKVGLGLADVAELQISVPSLAIQAERLAILEEMLAAGRAFGAAIARQLILLKERRQALITAAVTGQLDVTTARGVAS